MIGKSNVIDNKDIGQSIPTLVVADDDKDNTEFISFVLDALNFKYYLANDGKTALDLVYDKLPDLVLLDVVMPIIDGVRATKSIKSNLSTSHIPVIAVTGLTCSKDIIAIKDAGFDDYIAKPFMIEDLETKLKHFLKINRQF